MTAQQLVKSVEAARNDEEFANSGFAEWAGTLLRMPASSVLQLAETLLCRPAIGLATLEAKSDLNVNGSPLQILLSARTDRWDCRLIADPAFDCPDPLERWRKGREALQTLLELRASREIGILANRLLVAILPQSPEHFSSYPHGMIRLAASPERGGVAVYAAPQPGPVAAQWHTGLSAVRALLPDSRQAVRLIRAIENSGIFFGMGLEGAHPAQSRFKIYWRLKYGVPLASFGLPWFEADAFRQFLSDIAPSGSLPARALTFSAGFAAESGELSDVKVDVCTSIAGCPAMRWIDDTLRRLDLCPPFSEEGFADAARHGLAVGCVGLGLGIGERHRLNIYLYPCVQAHHSAGL